MSIRRMNEIRDDKVGWRSSEKERRLKSPNLGKGKI